MCIIYSEAVVIVSYITLVSQCAGCGILLYILGSLYPGKVSWPFRLPCSNLQIYPTDGAHFSVSDHELMIWLSDCK